MSNANEKVVLEGGEEQIQLLAQTGREGGNSAPQVAPESEKPSASSAGDQEGVESTLRIGNLAAFSATTSLQEGDRTFMPTFKFASPFLVPVNKEKTPDMFNEVSVKSSAPATSLRAPSPGESLVSGISATKIIFSKMSAKDLGQVVADHIHGFNTVPWNAEDVSGSAIIGHLAPSALSEFLEQTLNISSQFTRRRIQAILVDLIEKDTTIDEELREAWKQIRAPNLLNFNERASATMIHQTMPPSSALLPQALFQTPSVGGAVRATSAPSIPAIFSSRTASLFQGTAAYSPPSFLTECGSPDDFSMEDSTLFANTNRAAMTAGSARLESTSGGGNGFSITINQPSATPPKYVILNCASDSTEFYNWIRKNRKESLLALPVDRRTLSQLVSEDVKEEIYRIMRHLGPTNAFYFNADTCPWPRSWPEVSDHLLLKILFTMNGPRTAAEAKLRLKSRSFYFNDSTTSQDKFTTKLRKFSNDFKGTLKDFAYTTHMWELGDKLEHAMIIEAFSDCFTNVEQIKGPDGTTMVPKSRNYAKVKEMIREHKGQPLEEIVHFIVDAFERVDIAVRSSRSITYDVKPWKSDDSNKGRKRGFNQVAGQADQKNAKNARPARPATEFPRCNNCGRKSHACGERSCYLFGHPDARGPQGTWADGEQSLFIEKEKMKAWKITRDPVFYGYPENQRQKKGA